MRQKTPVVSRAGVVLQAACLLSACFGLSPSPEESLVASVAAGLRDSVAHVAAGLQTGLSERVAAGLQDSVAHIPGLQTGQRSSSVAAGLQTGLRHSPQTNIRATPRVQTTSGPVGAAWT